ncbi:hypothetical protein O0I10_002256 [Lichtheimia ornata]|uniref:FHA domain-containing protein n=1 Tax=Lichtheimia ornata TaxID=688661 RepID=A0AAD7Y0U5_9FUNG|nr:uncharacterized protein O0I10_002256 [Lichtheimia ornata]KAJ8661925.1 hypothetical protein O0I10_002256 [Lichtheimia ornata]
MWLFNPLNDQNQECGKILLCPGQEYTISRKVGDIVIQSDHSISRNHAVLKVDTATKRSVYNKKFKPSILLEDIKAKYGTYVNGKKLETALYLYDGDVVRFGALKSYFRLRWVPVVVCVSSMGSEDKTKVAESAASLGIQLKKEWDGDCTHLYMKEVDDTLNFMLCLVHGKPIISLAWFDALLEMGKTIEFTWPPTEEYLPPIRKACKNVKPEQCLPNNSRASLFEGLEFWFFDENNYNRYHAAIQAAEGDAKYCSMNRTYTIDAVTEEKRIIVAPPNDRHAVFREIKAKLKDRHRRYIESDEIITAIIECSTERACNPRLSRHNEQKDEQDDLFDLDEDDPLPHRSPPHARDVTQASTTTSNALDDMFDDILGDDNDDPLPPPSQLKKNTTSQPARTMEPSQSSTTVTHPSTTTTTTTAAAAAGSPPLAHNETATSTTSAAASTPPQTLSRNEANQQPRDTSTAAENSRRRNVTRKAKIITPTCQLVVSRSSPQQQGTQRAIDETPANGIPINTKRFRKETDVGGTQLMERLVHMRTGGGGGINYSRFDDEVHQGGGEGGDPFSDIRIRVNRVSTSSRRGRR